MALTLAVFRGFRPSLESFRPSDRDHSIAPVLTLILGFSRICFADATGTAVKSGTARRRRRGFIRIANDLRAFLIVFIGHPTVRIRSRRSGRMSRADCFGGAGTRRIVFICHLQWVTLMESQKSQATQKNGMHWAMAREAGNHGPFEVRYAGNRLGFNV